MSWPWLTATLLLLAATSPLTVRAHTDADGYETFTHISSRTPLNAYKLHTTRAFWDVANVACVREGAHLLVIESTDEARLARTLFARVPTPPTTLLDQLHVGLLDKAQEGVWKTVLGADLYATGQHVTWAAGQPDNAGANEHCGAITRDVFYNDLPCAKLYECPFICEKELPKRGVETVDGEVSLKDFIGTIDQRQATTETDGPAHNSRFLAILLRL